MSDEEPKPKAKPGPESERGPGPEPGFVTAAELRDAEAEADGNARGPNGRGDPVAFDIPERPKRRYPRSGGVEYVGGTQFSLSPAEGVSDADLAALVERVLDDGEYRWGDWFDLPMPLYLVHDDTTHDTFRVSVRDGRIELHVLPGTDSDGLRAFYERLPDGVGDWRVERHVDGGA
jgi:hypothetical protein